MSGPAEERPAAHETPRILRLAIRLAVVANLAIGTAYVALLAVLMATGRTRGSDFTAFYTGWRIVLEGNGSQLYDTAVQTQVQRTILGGQTFAAGLNPFNNPPHMVLPFVPLGLLPLDVAFLVWTGIQALLLVWVVAMLLRGVAQQWTRLERLGLVAAFVAFPPLAITFFQGAFALVLVATLVGTLAAMNDGRDARAGGLLALASVKPQGMFGVALAVLLSRRRAALAALVGWGLLLVVVATAVLGPGIWASYLGFLGTYTSSFDKLSVDPAVMWNLRGTLALLLGRDNATLVNSLAYVGFVLGLLAIAWLWRRGWPRSSASGHVGGDTALRIALTIVVTLLLSPHLNPHDDALAAVAVVLAYGALRGTTGGRIVGAGAMIAPAAILVVNGIAADAPTTLPIRFPTLLLVALAAVIAASLRRNRSQVLA